MDVGVDYRRDPPSVSHGKLYLYEHKVHIMFNSQKNSFIMARMKNPIELLRDYGVAGVQVQFSNRDIDHLDALIGFFLSQMQCERTKDGNIISKDERKVEEKLPIEVLAVVYGLDAIIKNHKTEDNSIFNILNKWSVAERYCENKPQPA